MLIQLHSEPKAILILVGGLVVGVMFSFQDKTDALVSHSWVTRLLVATRGGAVWSHGSFLQIKAKNAPPLCC